MGMQKDVHLFVGQELRAKMFSKHCRGIGPAELGVLTVEAKLEDVIRC